ncbi:hypothetical protein [Halomicronema hongdechloris]|uniref:hypothetical protein n=1 Tax=Halomicronema hongdechloris TaxID=1209493 RepID=UPI0010CADFC7|nr:hypothetical protein [Halomicronema hongdechloris]
MSGCTNQGGREHHEGDREHHQGGREQQKGALMHHQGEREQHKGGREQQKGGLAVRLLRVGLESGQSPLGRCRGWFSGFPPPRE